MYNQIIPIVLVGLYLFVFLYGWKTALDRRVTFLEQTTKIINDKNVSHLTKELIAKFFLLSGTHFFILGFLWWQLTMPLLRWLDPNGVVFDDRKNEEDFNKMKRNEISQKELEEIIQPCAFEMMKICMMISPIQSVLLFLIFIIDTKILKRSKDRAGAVGVLRAALHYPKMHLHS